MADNYLETKMEQYRSGVRPVRRRSAGQRVVVAGSDSVAVLAEAARHAAAGCRTAVLAAPTGTPSTVRAYPASMPAAEALRRIIHDWHDVDLLVLCGDAPGVEDELAAQRSAIPAPIRSAAFRVVIIG